MKSASGLLVLWVTCLLLPALSFGWQEPIYDILLKGGHVIDPRNERDGVFDVAIADGKIARMGRNIPEAGSRRVVDVAGLYVTPGLIDIHTHVYTGTGRRGAYNGDNSVYPDGFTFRCGVTTVVDVGGSGWRDFEDFKDRVIDRSKTRVLAMLNIVGYGMSGGPIEQNTLDMEPEPTAAMARKYPRTIVGIKTAHYAAPDWTAVDRALEAGNLADLPVMVDFGKFMEVRPFERLVSEKLRPGDIYTHAYLRWVPMFDAAGKVRDYLFQAQKRGVIFDVGHGGGSFSFRMAAPATQQGFWPNSISTDLHIGSMNSGMKNQLNVMSKFLNLGMSLTDVIKASTWNPAQEIRREGLGHLSEGAVADVAVLALHQGQFGFLDIEGGRMDGTQKLECELTLKDGQVQYDLNARAADHWTVTPHRP